ncbi:MAG TPA: Rieske 2Fe-2S domain-containing protein [Chloroflexota bacterium]
MLTPDENEVLTRVGPGTPMGNLLRRYWQPIAAATELTADRAKLRLTILGEELVLFRDEAGEYGLVAEHCSHRGVSVYYGFLENGCIRCPYHGWMYDKEGNIVETPFEPAQSLLKHTLKHTAYPVQKMAGFIWAYMGPQPAPLLPRWDILAWEQGTRRLEIRPVLNCNWLQAEENTGDVTHTYFLHAYTMASKGRADQGAGFGRPFYEYGFQPFKWGILKSWTYGGERGGSGWGNLLVFPNMLRLEGAMHWRVPIDDTHTKIMRVEWWPAGRAPRYGPPIEPTPPGQDPLVSYEASWVNTQGEYHMDTFSSQDGMAWETQGPIFDRSREHLGASDTGIMLLREKLMDNVKRVQEGLEPDCLVREPAQNECIDLEGWLAERDYAAGTAGTIYDGVPKQRHPAEEVFDGRHQQIEISSGPARLGVVEALAQAGHRAK